MTVHGWLSMSWVDPRLRWDANAFGKTYSIRLRSSKLWRPSIDIYNIASGNTRRALNFWRNRASLYSSGFIYFWSPTTFPVTCELDYTNFPFDVQECPIVVGDWVHPCDEVIFTNRMNESKVNVYMAGFAMGEKVHAAGWELVRTRRRHKFLGAYGIVDQVPEGQSKRNYWSFAVYWLKLRRHRPYFGVIDVMPGVLTSFLTLTVFFIDSENVALMILLGNLVGQTIFGFDLLQSLPGNSGGIPKIVKLYGSNFALTGIALLLHIFMFHARSKWADFSLPAALRSLGQKMYSYRAFQAKNLQFDPQQFFEEENQKEALSGDDSLKLTNQEPEDIEEEAESEMTFSDYLSVARRLLFLVFALLYCIVLITTLFA